MYKWLYSKKGQSTGEYALIFAIVLGAAIAMQTYIKRGLQYRIKSGADLMTAQTPELGNTSQYDPYYYYSKYDSARSSAMKEGYYEGRSENVIVDPDDKEKAGVEKTLRGGETIYGNVEGNFKIGGK